MPTPKKPPAIIIKVLQLIWNYLLEVFLNVLHSLGAEMLAVVDAGKAQNADTVRVIQLLFHVPSTSLKH